MQTTGAQYTLMNFTTDEDEFKVVCVSSGILQPHTSNGSKKAFVPIFRGRSESLQGNCSSPPCSPVLSVRIFSAPGIRTPSLAPDFLFLFPFWFKPHLRNLPLTFVPRCPCPRLGNLSPPAPAPRPFPSVPLLSSSPLLPSSTSCPRRPSQPGQSRSLAPCPRVLSPQHTYIPAFLRHLCSYPHPGSPRWSLPPQLFHSARGGRR